MANLQLRMKFSKTGDLRFISHLDMTRAFHRAFIRAGIRLKFSEGFSPHPKFSFLLPLSVGMESLCEICDFTLEDESDYSPLFLPRLSSEMPKGIKLISISDLERRPCAFADYSIMIKDMPLGSAKKEEAHFSAPVIVKKKTKKGTEKEMDLLEGIKSIRFSEKDGVLLAECTLRADPAGYLNPEFIASAVSGDSGNEILIRRTAIRDENMNIL